VNASNFSQRRQARKGKNNLLFFYFAGATHCQGFQSFCLCVFAPLRETISPPTSFVLLSILRLDAPLPKYFVAFFKIFLQEWIHFFQKYKFCFETCL
jgi:hypothetical protein